MFYNLANSLTPLHFAVRARNIQLILELYKHKELEKFSRFIRSGQESLSGADLARELDFEDVYRILLEVGPAEHDAEIERIGMKVDLHDFFNFEKSSVQ